MIAVLLVNLGSPQYPTPEAIRHYLAEFLSDRRVVDRPDPWLWWLILHGVILPTRPSRLAGLYQKIWTEKGSPLITTTEQQANLVKQWLIKQAVNQEIVVTYGMRYGQPHLSGVLERLKTLHPERLIVLPLFPQYSGATTGSVWNFLAEKLESWQDLPDLHFISHYYDDPAYLDALAARIRAYWAENGMAQQLLFSFHGLPQRRVEAGDPYQRHCQETAQKVASRLKLDESQWSVAFQSRFGREVWLTPYTDEQLVQFVKEGVRHVHVVCPGFAADCLETLEEIAEQNRDKFLQAGGERYDYIPALNDSVEHIEALGSLIMRFLG